MNNSDATGLPGSNDLTMKTILLLMAACLNAAEFFIPRIPLFPWIKPGLANCVTIVWIVRYGLPDAIAYACLRVWIVSFFFGFSFVTVLLSLGGSLAAIAAMGIFWHLLGTRGWIGVIGLGVVGAAFHNLGQLASVWLLLDANRALLYQIPLMLIASVLFGSAIGLLALPLARAAESKLVAQLAVESTVFSGHRIVPLDATISLLLFGLCMALTFITSTVFIAICTVTVTLSVQLILHGSLPALIFPIRRFWMFFLFTATVQLFFSYGRSVSWLPGATWEGLNQTGLIWLRLWCWLQCSLLFKRFSMHELIFRGLRSVFKKSQTTLLAGMYSLSYFPSMVESGRTQAKRLIQTALFRPGSLIDEIMTLAEDALTERKTSGENGNHGGECR